MSLPTSARLTIDLDALAHNFAVLRAQAAGADAAPVIKADGYGLGAAQVARRLWAEGAQGFFVARLSEGESLRAALGAEHPATIYVLDGFLAGAGPRLAAARLTPVLSSLPQIVINDDQAHRLRMGNPIILRGRDAPVSADEAYATARGKLVAIGEIGGGEFRPKRVFGG